MGSAAAVFTRWPPHRLHLRQGRRRQHLDHECRWFGQTPADQGGFPPHQSGKLVARRQLHRRQEAFHHPAFARHRRDLDLPCLGWGRCPAGEAGERHLAKGTGRARLFAQWRCGVLFAQRHIRADFRICAGFHAGNLRHRALRSGNRRSDDSRQRIWRRGSPAAFARWQEHRLYPPGQGQDRALGQGSGERSAAHDLWRPRHGHAGNLGRAWLLSLDGLDAGRQFHRAVGGRQVTARLRRWQRRQRYSLYHRRYARRCRCTPPGNPGFARQLYGQDPAVHERIARRTNSGVRKPGQAVFEAGGGRNGAASDVRR